MLKINNPEPKTWEAKPSSHVEPLMDTKAKICDPLCSYHPYDLFFDLYDCHPKRKDPFWVIESGLYHKISPIVYYFLELIPCLVTSYVYERNFFISPTRENILEVTLELIQMALLCWKNPILGGLQKLPSSTVIMGSHPENNKPSSCHAG